MLKKGGLLPVEFPRNLGNREGYLRLPFFVFAGVLFLILLVCIYEYIDYRQDERELRKGMETFESQQTLQTLQMIHFHAIEDNWQEVYKIFVEQENLLPNSRALLINPTGSIIISRKVDTRLSSPETWLFNAIEPLAPQVHWSDDGKILTTGIPVLNRDGTVKLYLLRETNLSEQIGAYTTMRLNRLMLFLLGIVIVVAGILLVIRWLFLHPLSNIYKLSRTIARGTLTVRAPSSPIVELQKINQAFNEMIDHLASQQTALENLNRSLEDTVAERTHALEISNTAVRKQVQQLEEINALFTTTAGVLDVKTLANTALEKAITTANCENGVIWLLGYFTSRGLPDSQIELFKRVRKQGDQFHVAENRNVVNNWALLDESHPLKRIGLQLDQIEVQALVSIPLTISGAQVGMLCIGNWQPRIWTSDELVLIETIAHHLGTAAERIQHIENIRHYNHLMRRLMVQSELLNRTLTQTEVIATIGQGTMELCDTNRLGIFLVVDGGTSCAWSQNLSPILIDSIQKALYPVTSTLLFDDVTQMEEACEVRLLGEKMGFRALHTWPLTFEDQVMAFACCFYESPRSCARNEQEVFETFFRQGAAALESARLYQAETTQRRLSEALGDIAATLNSTLDLETVLQGILSNLGRVVQHDTAAIMLLENGLLQMAHSAGQTEKTQWPKGEWKFYLHEIPTLRRIYETGQALIIPNTDLDPNWIRFDRSIWIKSYAGAPIFRRGEIVGFINVNSSIPDFYSPKIGLILQAFANQAAIALENARLYQNVHARMNEANTLYRAIRTLINAAEDEKALMQQITASVTQEFASTHCSFFLVDPIQQTLMLQAQSGDRLVDMPDLSLNGSGLTVAAVRTGQPVYSPDVTLSSNYVIGMSQTRSELAIPLFSGSQVFGVLNLESSQVDAFDERARRMLATFCEQAALGLENARLFATIREQAAQRKQINDITQTALKVTSSGQMLQQLAEQVAALLKSDGCYITWWETNGHRTIPMAAYGPNQEIYSQLPIIPNEINLTYSSLMLGKTLIIPDVHHSPYIPSEVAREYPIRSIMVLPLIADGQKIGAVLIGFVEEHTFTPEEISLGEQASGQIALAMARLRSVELAQRRAQEADNLRMATASLGSSLELHQVLNDILTYLEKVIHHDSACIFLLEEERYHVWAVKNITGQSDVLNRQFPRNDPLLRSVEVERRPITLVNAHEDPRLHCWGWTEKVARWMGIPLTSGSEFLGILTLERYKNNDFTQEEISLALAFAGQAAIAVQNARLYQNTQQRALELEALHTATTSLVSTLDLQKLLEGIVSAAASAIPATQTAALHLLTEERQLDLRVQLGDFEEQNNTETWNDGRGPWTYVLNGRCPLLVNNASHLPKEIFHTYQMTGSFMIAPLIQEGHVLGMLTLASHQESAFSEPDLRLMISFASTATAALHNAQLHRAVQHMAITDPLTGLYNRRGFYDLAGHLLKQVQFFGRPLSAIMMDIDYFKKINDQYGHDTGDAVLQTLAMRFRKVLRDADIICRFGGEEFAILLPESDIIGARNAAARLHHVITATPVDSAAGPITVTMSIGVAQFSSEDHTLDDLLKDADKALYTAKAKGRNQVSVWNE